ncbi:MAG: IclR family transcriptional regulator [Reyranellaceae bacterium]
MAASKAESEKDGAGGVAAVERALTIAATLAEAGEPLTLAALARRTGYYKSTLLRLLVSLERFGYSVRLRDGRYALGGTAFRLGVAYERSQPLRNHVEPVLAELAAQGTESPSFHVWHDAHRRLCLFRRDSAHATLDRIQPGDLLPLRRGAAGRVLLAFAGEAGESYDAIRRDLLAISHGERDPVCAGLACPVFGPGDVAIGALSVSGPRERFTEDNVRRMTGLLLQAGIGITEALGGDARGLRAKLAAHEAGARPQPRLRRA